VHGRVSPHFLLSEEKGSPAFDSKEKKEKEGAFALRRNRHALKEKRSGGAATSSWTGGEAFNHLSRTPQGKKRKIGKKRRNGEDWGSVSGILCVWVKKKKKEKRIR